MTYAELAANPYHKPLHDRWMSDPLDRDYLAPADRWCILCARPDHEHVTRPATDDEIDNSFDAYR